MPTDMTIPTMVQYYLDLIQKLSIMTLDHDSLSKESLMLQAEIQHYLGLIRDDMTTFAKEVKVEQQ